MTGERAERNKEKRPGDDGENDGKNDARIGTEKLVSEIDGECKIHICHAHSEGDSVGGCFFEVHHISDDMQQDEEETYREKLPEGPSSRDEGCDFMRTLRDDEEDENTKEKCRNGGEYVSDSAEMIVECDADDLRRGERNDDDLSET